MKPLRSALEVIGLDPLGIVRVRGADAVKFLQGQLSNDVAQLSAEHSLLAGYHNPQGRTIALVRLVQWHADDILVVVPRELATVVASRLAKFILRAKVKVADDSAGWRVVGIVGGGLAGGGRTSAGGASAVGGTTSAGGASAANAGGDTRVGADTATADLTDDGRRGLLAPDLPTSVGAQVPADGAAFVCVSDQPPRWLVISPADAPSPVLDYPSADLATWQLLEVAAGQPQVYTATSEEFVAQMLNLDALDAIAFDKGCYTGQEVIARANYRGRVKRRMQRFVTREAGRLSPGDSGQLADGRTFKVVQAAQRPDGRCEFLAVAPITATESEGVAPAEAATRPASSTPAAAIVLAEQAELPYLLPN